MLNTSLIGLLVALAGGAASAALTVLVLSSSGSPDVGARPGPDADVTAQIRQLTEQNHALLDRVAALESRPQATVRRPARQAADPAIEEEVRSLLAQMEEEASSPVTVEEKVRRTIESIRGEERAAKDEIARQHTEEWVRGQVAKLTPTLQLTPSQATAVEGLLLDKAVAGMEIKALWEAGAPRDSLGEVAAASKEALDQGLQEVLTPTQYDIYTTDVAGAPKGAPK